MVRKAWGRITEMRAWVIETTIQAYTFWTCPHWWTQTWLLLASKSVLELLRGHVSRGGMKPVPVVKISMYSYMALLAAAIPAPESAASDSSVFSVLKNSQKWLHCPGNHPCGSWNRSYRVFEAFPWNHCSRLHSPVGVVQQPPARVCFLYPHLKGIADQPFGHGPVHGPSHDLPGVKVHSGRKVRASLPSSDHVVISDSHIISRNPSKICIYIIAVKNGSFQFLPLNFPINAKHLNKDYFLPIFYG